MSKYVVLLISIFGLCVVVQAQDATGTPTESTDETLHHVQAWRATYTDEAGEALTDAETGESVGTDVAFLEFDGGIISVWPGADFIYTGDDEAGYSGHFLIADPDIDVTTTLQIIDEDTRREVQSTNLFGTEQLSYITYTRTDDEIEIWSESERNFIETTMLGECLGLMSVNLSFGWVAPDVLMPIRFEEDGSVLMDYRVYEGGENVDSSTRPMTDGSTTTTVVTRTVDAGESTIEFRLHGIIDERDDCEMIYESIFTPFDADFDSIMTRAEAIGAESESD